MRKVLLAALFAACSSPSKPQPEPPKQPDETKTVLPEVRPAVVESKQLEAVEDPYLWLEEVTSDKALEWARAQNAKSKGELEAHPSFAQTRDRIRAILDSKEKTPYVQKRGNFYYNFWRDAQNPKGLLRRTTLAEYKKKDPKWETVLDVDALAKEEKENWVYAGISCVYPKFDRCLVSMSRGGGDAKVTRELDVTTKQFVKDGFFVPEFKSRVSWKDRDTVYVGTDFGPGSLTKSGYPRVIKEWKRGTKLETATTVFEGQESDVAAAAFREWDHGKSRDYFFRLARRSSRARCTFARRTARSSRSRCPPTRTPASGTTS